MDYERSITIDMPYAEAVRHTREALAEQGFGILTEIDVQATLKEKRGLDMEPYVILGALQSRPRAPSARSRARHRRVVAVQRSGRQRRGRLTGADLGSAN